MRLVPLVSALLILAALAFPSAASQSLGQGLGATDRCVKNCTPEDVNGPTARTGNESVGVVLFAHMEDILQLAPYNTQRPDPRREPDQLHPLGPCLVTRTNTPADLRINGCELKFFSSPGLVEYVSDGWRTHADGGMIYDATLASSTINLHVTLRAASVAPNVGIYARIDAGRHSFAGPSIAESAPGASAPKVTLVSMPGDTHQSWEYEVPMVVKRPTLPAPNGFVVLVRVFQLDEPTATVTQPGISFHSGAKFPPRMAFSVKNPLRTESANLVGFKGNLFVRWGAASTWGSYDVLDKSVSIRSSGPTPIPAEWIEYVILKRAISDDGKQRPVNMTWALDYKKHALADGQYELTTSILNLQETYRLEQAFPFEVRKGVPMVPGADFRGDTSPAAPLPLFAVLLLVGLALLRAGGRSNA